MNTPGQNANAVAELVFGAPFRMGVPIGGKLGFRHDFMRRESRTGVGSTTLYS